MVDVAVSFGCWVARVAWIACTILHVYIFIRFLHSVSYSMTRPALPRRLDAPPDIRVAHRGQSHKYLRRIAVATLYK